MKTRKYKKLKEELKNYRIYTLVLFGCLISIFLTVLVIQINNYYYEKGIKSTKELLKTEENSSNLQIYFEGLTDSQKEMIKFEILNKLKWGYFSSAKSINFTTSVIRCSEGNVCSGSNWNWGNIEIHIENNITLEELKRTLCHEFLHDFVRNTEYTKDFDEDKIIGDIANYNVCYK